MSRDTKMIKQLRRHYTYTAAQLQEQFGVHPQTLRKWAKDAEHPLPVMCSRPIMVFSEDLRVWLSQRHKANRERLQRSEFYCMGCKKARTPLENKVAVLSRGQTTRLVAYCSHCMRQMNKMQGSAKLASVRPMFKTVSLEDLHISGRTRHNEKTHLAASTKPQPNESYADTTRYEQQMLL